jgi:hypothetical protein
VITASEPSWIAPFTGLSPRCCGKLVTALRSEGADETRCGRPWDLPLEDRLLLVTAYWLTNLTLRQLALLFNVSKSAADRVVANSGRCSRSNRVSGSRRTPYSSWTAPWRLPATVGFGFESGGEHPAGARADDVVDQGAGSRSIHRRSLCPARACLPARRYNVGLLDDQK